ncbi:DUF7118 family protein, partial [Natrinema soli]
MSERVHSADGRSNDSVGSDDGPAPLEALEAARQRFETAERRITEHGEETVEEVAAAHRDATKLLDDYVDRATGTGKENFQAYIELEGKFDGLVSSLSDGLVAYESFEESLEAIDKRRLSESDFERAREALAPAAEYADLLEEREAAREA